MKHLLIFFVGFTLATPFALGEPPAKPKNPGKPPEFFQARREALAARKEARKQRMKQFQAARAAREEQLYHDWHERYLADAPVRVEYYRAMSNAYLAEEAWARERAAFLYSWQPVVYFPPAPIYAPCWPGTIYGTMFWSW